MDDLVKKKIVAIIPARGGSKRIPHKNIIDFDGKPLIAWTIEAAFKSGIFDKVVVSTDDEIIAKISRDYGAEVPFLRDQHADDYSPVSEGTLSTIRQLEDKGLYFDEVIQLFAVCPLRNALDIVEAYSNFKDNDLKLQISCYKFTWMNPWWAIELDNSGKPEWIFDTVNKRSQDLPQLYSPTGAIWIANVDKLKSEGTFYGSGHRFHPIDWKRAVDIDNYEDIELAQMLKKIDQKQGG